MITIVKLLDFIDTEIKHFNEQNNNSNSDFIAQHCVGAVKALREVRAYVCNNSEIPHQAVFVHAAKTEGDSDLFKTFEQNMEVVNSCPIINPVDTHSCGAEIINLPYKLPPNCS